MNIQNLFQTLSTQSGFYLLVRNQDQILYVSDPIVLSLEKLLPDMRHYIEYENRWYDVKICEDTKTGYQVTTFYDISLYMCILKETDAHIIVKDREENILFLSSTMAKELQGRIPIDGKAHYIKERNAWFECHESMALFDQEQYKIQQYIEVTQYIEENEGLKYDELTGLYNRHGMLGRLRNMVSEINTQEFIVIIGDIDYFKQINDTYGHDAGDMVLKQIGQILLHAIPDGFCGRYGGEEFLIVLNTDQMDMAYQSVEKIRKQLEMTEFKVKDQVIHITMSFGISKYHKDDCLLKEDSMCISRLVKTADIALMTSKQTGRNKTLIYNEYMQKKPE